MKLRFLAAAGDAEARGRLADRLAPGTPAGVIEVRSDLPMSLWVEDGTPTHQASDGSAIAVGLLFDRSSERRLATLRDRRTDEHAWTRAFWGSYVLLRADQAAHSVLRDPSGAIPVYYAARDGLHLYASDAEMLRMAWPEPFQPNLDAVRHWLRFPFLRTARTGAIGVHELLPGMVRHVGPGRESVSSAWRPDSFAVPGSTIRSFEEASSFLRTEVLRSVRLLAQGQPTAVLQLSGGLDSSIVAAALANAGIGYRALTFATHSADGDERRYARLVATQFGVELVELTEAEIDLSVRMASGPLQRPPSPLLQALRQRLVAAAGADALLLDGGGGDNVFVSINTAAPAIDAFNACGFAEGITALRNIAARHGVTVWTAGRSALRRALGDRTMPWTVDDSFLLGPAHPRTPDAHSWLEALDGLLPGRADHLRMIVGIHHFLIDPAEGEPCNLHPLVCQPIVEACLRIGSWLWFKGGRDRAVARAAFRDMLPEAILARRGKGSLQSMFVRGFQAKRGELRDELVAGRLAENGIIDPAAIAAYFDRSGEPHDTTYIRILEIASAEQWLRSFH